MSPRISDPFVALHSRFVGSKLHSDLSSSGLHVSVEEDILYDACTGKGHCFLFLDEDEMKRIHQVEASSNEFLHRFSTALLASRKDHVQLVALLQRKSGEEESAGFTFMQELLFQDCLTLPVLDESSMAKVVASIVAEEVGSVPVDNRKPPSVVAAMCKQLAGVGSKALVEIATTHSLAKISQMSEEELSNMKSMGKMSSRKLFHFLHSNTNNL